MLGLMQNRPLLISELIGHAERHHGDVEIVSRRVDADIQRTTYRHADARSQQLANALDGEGVFLARRPNPLALEKRLANGKSLMTWCLSVHASARHRENAEMKLREMLMDHRLPVAVKRSFWD